MPDQPALIGQEVPPTDPAGCRPVRLASAAELIQDQRRTLTTVDGHEILALAVAGRCFAVSNECTHARGWLDAGDVYPDTLEIECLLHNGRFSLVTGAATALPCVRPIQVFEVLVHGSDVYALVPEATQGNTEKEKEN
jgi:nitrite reductase/ring-hydroxylating ferredoxin subunit